MNESYNWYATLLKPTWAPPSWIFGPVWSVLYVIIAISFGYVVYKTIKGEVSFVILLPFIINILANVLFTPLQCGLKNNLLAFLDIIIVLASLIWALLAIYPQFPWVAIVNIPYTLWVSFATILQATITWMNRGK